MSVEKDEFYVGYETSMPPGIARRVTGAVAIMAATAAAAVVIAVIAADTLPASTFEFGVVNEMSGVLRRTPYPTLDVEGRRLMLVGTGKSGADQVLAGIPDGPVVLTGSRIQRGRHEMLEVHTAAPARDVTLRGEIVDSKCFLGVMNPAEGPVHRDCARRCLSGGIPPMLVVRDGTHAEELVLLVSNNGGPLSRDVVPAAGEPVTMTGRLARTADGYVLFVIR